MDDTESLIKKSVEELTTEIGLPADFLPSLKGDSDWAFVIKLHALIEAAVTHALIGASGFDDASEVFANLELSNSRTGKLAFMKVLLVDLEPEDRRFIRSLSELRNVLVHDVRNVAFTLSGYFSSLGIDAQRNFIRNFGYVVYGDDESPAALDKAIESSRAKLRPLILRSALALVAMLQLHLSNARARREALRRKAELADLVTSSGMMDAVGKKEAG